MKNLFVLAFLFFTLSASAIVPPTVENGGDDLKENIVKSSEVPPEVLEVFYESFITGEEGEFRGAYVFEILHYIPMEEVRVLIVDSGADLAAEVQIFQGYKPKTRGCKSNSRWICTVRGNLAN